MIYIYFLPFILEKVIYAEVTREYYIEFHMPGETHFIVIDLLINSFFILYMMYNIY
jgi:hypothetical protein